MGNKRETLTEGRSVYAHALPAAFDWFRQAQVIGCQYIKCHKKNR